MNAINTNLQKMKLEKQRNGEYLSSYTPYGYFAKSEPYRHLEIDISIARNIIYTGVTPLSKRKWIETEMGKCQIKQGTIEIVEGM